jgi:hypothetical protein
MKIIRYLPLFLCLLGVHNLMAQTDTTIRYIESDFETVADQQQWTSIPTDNTIKWKYENGGNDHNPASAYSGSKNALYYWSDLNPYTRTLVSPAIDLSTAKKPELSFAHAMSESVFGQDNMILLFRAGSSGTWDVIEEYTQEVPSWTLRNINIKDYGTKYLTDKFYVAFRGISNSGDGVCIDQVIIEEKDVIIRYPKSVDIKAVNHDLIPSGVVDIPVMRVDIVIVGNTNPATLKSMVFKSLSSHDSLFAAGGFELVATRDSVYRPRTSAGASLKIGSATSISAGTVTFSTINYNLPTGFNSIWLIADMKSTAPHGSIVDFRMDANGLMINTTSYPATGVSPAGSNLVEEAILLDSFENNDKGWVFQGAMNDFEMAVPQGKFAHISNDPDYAYSGYKSLGTDLTGDGKYELNINSSTAYYAVSPAVDLKFYANVKLHFMKWFAFEANDHATIEVSTDTAKTWTVIWDNKLDYISPDTRWLEYTVTKKFNDLASRKPWVQVRFGISYSDGTFAYAGWNLDNFAITGDYLSNDVGITSLIKPIDDCLNPGMDVVTIKVQNYAPQATAASLPVFFSVDGTTKVYDNIPGPIAVDGQVTFTFSQPANITSPDLYDAFIVELDIPGDEDASNDTVTRDLFIQESLSVPHYETFESFSGYWKPVGSSPTWECKQPEGIIPPRPGSPKAWILSPYGPYIYDDTSYMVSSCYDLVTGDRLIYEMQLWLDAEEGKDGAAVEYTVDDGATWTLLSANTYGWDWNWYNTYVTALGTQGWSEIGAGWRTVKQLLPASLASEPKVKFRVKWASGSETNYRGVVFDNVNIFAAPDDIGVSAIHDFADACEGLNPDQLKVTIKNYGLNTMNSNDTIVVGFDLDNNPVAVDTFKLTQNLAPNQSMTYTFPDEIDVLAPGLHAIRAYTLIEEDPWFYEDNNDTTSVSFTIKPKPYIGLPDTIQTKKPDTVFLRPVYNPNYDYLWQDNKTDSVYDVNKGQWYIVTVTDTRGNGCSAKDSTFVELLFYDVGVDSLIYPYDACSYTNQEYVSLRIKNFGTDSIPAGEKIKAVFVFNKTKTVIDTITLAERLYAKHTLIYHFDKEAVNLSAKGTYTFKLYAEYPGDTVPGNDTVNKSITVFGNPVANLGPDLTIQALSYTLDAGPGYIDYLWDNTSTSRTRTITETGTFWVWVLDAHNCSDFDTVYIRLKIRDISPQLDNPLSACTFNPSETVRMKIVNTGTDTVPSGETINVRYKMNSGSWVTGSRVLSSQLLPAASVVHTFPGTVNLNTPNDYIFTLVAKTATDIRVANDTLVDTVYRYEKPDVDFGLDESVTARVTEFPIEAGYQPFYSYLWQNGWTEHEYIATTSGKYSVIVTDTRTSCYGDDTVTLFLIIDDVGITSSTLGSSLCSGTYSDVKVNLKNLGSTSIGAGTTIYVGCDLNGSRIEIDTLVLDKVFSVGTSRQVTLKKPITISPSTTPVIDFYSIFSVDMKPQNDTLTLNPTVKSSPVVDFGDDNGILMVALPHVLDAGSGHKSYVWNNGSTNQTYTVTVDGTYSVTVTGQNNCQTYKVVYINPSSVDDLSSRGGSVMVYPNPSNGLFYLDIRLEHPQELRIILVSVNGQVVSSQNVAAQESLRYPVDLTGYPGGIYQILISGDSILYKAKVIIY